MLMSYCIIHIVDIISYLCLFCILMLIMYSTGKGLIQILLSFNIIYVQSDDTNILTDLAQCKVSHLGLEYLGNIATTEAGIRCQAWETQTPVHKVDESFTDDKFSDFSRKLAKNYCRNPNRDPKGPWCYTLDSQLIDDTCGISLCNYTDCRLTGPGMEYGGVHNHGISDKKCLKWDKTRKKVKHKGGHIKLEKFAKEQFPDEDLGSAKKYCRNPDGDIAGPWCFVDTDKSGVVEREYCDIPFCDNQDCVVFSKNYSTYTHYTDFNDTLANLTFGLKVWDSDFFASATARLILTVLALPFNGKQIADSGIGIEIFISNKVAALTFGNKDKPEYESTVGVLKSTEFTFFSLSWTAGLISLTKEGEMKPIFLAEYKTKKNLLGFMKDKFYFYAAQGTNMLWSFPFCDNEGDCDVHTTTSSLFQQFWPLRDTSVGHDLQFFLRAFHSASILLVTSPILDYPWIEIMLDRPDNFTRVYYTEFEGQPKTLLKEITLKPLLDYWKWNEFSISFFADTLNLYWTKDVGTHMIMEIKHEIVRKMRWFSPSSENSVAHWTFYCKPPQFAEAPNAWPPECALNSNEPDYKGTQGVTWEGLPCVPWSGKNILPDDAEDLFSGKEGLQACNYCRDPKQELKGTFCYALRQNPAVTITKEYCRIRKCKSAECRMAGTGNDYIGKLNTTRSNRTCSNWMKYIMKHKINPDYLNDTLYPDTAVEAAENFCRNPTRNIAGSWCYTTDINITQDICDVRDCNKPEECIILVEGEGEGRDIYILPQWKETGMHGGLHFAVKQWNPDLLDGILFKIKSLNGDKTIKLIVGAEDNEKILLYYQDKLRKQKTFTRLIPAGKWISFWLQIRKEEILLGYEGIPHALFEWRPDQTDAFDPVFLSYMSAEGDAMGIFFECSDCHSEVTTVKHFTKIMPIGLWYESESLFYKNLTINIRGIGTAFVPLMILPGIGEYYQLIFGGPGDNLTFIRKHNKKVETLLSVQFNYSLYTNSSWTTFVVQFEEYDLNVTRNGTVIAHYKSSSPLLFYWFSVGSENGPIIWTANCNPPDIDGQPLNGGWSHWSPWQCTVSCGGGEGYRTRTCSNPRPNIFGKLCEGPPTSTGRCNDFECGDISPETLNKIRDHLQTQHFSFEITEGDSVILENDNEILEIVSTQSPDAYYQWTLNGIFVSTDPGRIELKDDNLIIKNANVSVMGVYVCMIFRVNKERVIFRVISLAVTTKKYAITTRATLDVILVSNAVVLGYIYSDLSQKWLLNDAVYIDYGITTLAAVSAEHLNPLNRSHTGTWKCMVEQSDLHLSWITNIVKLNVKRAPNIYTHLREDPLTAPIFSWLKSDESIFVVIVLFVVLLCLAVALCLFAYLKWGTLTVQVPVQKRKYKRNRLK